MWKENIARIETIKPENEIKETGGTSLQVNLNVDAVGEPTAKRKRGRPKKLETGVKTVEKGKPSRKIQTEVPLTHSDLMPAKMYRRRTSADEKRISDAIEMKCDLCNAVLESFSHALIHHKEVHNQTGYLVCCSKKFRQKTALVDHLDFHDNPQAFTCKVCQKSFPGLTNLKWHLQFIHFSPSYQCDICGQLRKTKRCMKSHIESHMTDLSKARLNPCQICKKICNSELSLKLHVNHCHNPNRETFCCEVCGKKLMSKLSLKEHIANTHSSTIIKTPCPICGHFIKNESCMKKHLSRHKYDTNIACKLCERICTTRAALSSHMKMKHLLERNLPCRFCEKKFKQKIALSEHEATHTGIDLYSCLWCTATFKFSANFRAHRKTAHPEEYEKIKPSWLRPT